jgi:hypothetical protein
MVRPDIDSGNLESPRVVLNVRPLHLHCLGQVLIDTVPFVKRGLHPIQISRDEIVENTQNAYQQKNDRCQEH